ncbi:hypothetical protein [Rhizobium oryziradicis]|uniref:Uncharacterized protein n=1 Tax=Rhizobium oryziradicis TaxID=1867956 RepID=A0A1Q8ZMC9_9HYPH|nr:hypothetical protein [Rhizobium oryziradicis]OLP43060.1 hypothetical protein BJF95_19150 [Rhizobium oryziradicis]
MVVNKKRKLSILTAMIVLSLSIWGLFSMFKNTDPADSAPRTIKISTGETVKSFIEQNDLQIGPWVQKGYVVDADDIADISPIIFDDNWIKLEVEDGAQSFELPPGRTLFISQTAGLIDGIAFRPFAKAKPLSEMQAFITKLLGTLEAKGWQPTSKIKIPSMPDDFDLGGKSLFADLESASGNTLQMQLQDYGAAPKQESYIIAPSTNGGSNGPSHTYVLLITIDKLKVSRTYADLILPRRIFVFGDPSKRLPLRYWIDDPDWTPEKAGMVPTTPEERANVESSKWKMPPK